MRLHLTQRESSHERHSGTFENYSGPRPEHLSPRLGKDENAVASPLSMTPARFRKLGNHAVNLAARHLERQDSDLVRQPMSKIASENFDRLTLPEQSLPEDVILDFLSEKVMAYPLGNDHAGFFGWITSAAAPIGILADFLATTTNANCAPGEHATVKLEEAATRWLMELIGFPIQGSRGLLVSGGSMANLTALAIARHWAAARMGHDIRRDGATGLGDFVIYQSAEAHSCIRKAVELLGLGGRCLRTIPVDDGLRMRMDALEDAVASDRAAGLRPVCVVATAGTVNSGAIDPLGDIADFCTRNELWFHVDGAYGGIAAADPSLSGAMSAIGRAQSVALDPHKWLSVPIECGAVLIRDEALQHETFSLHAAYLRGKSTPQPIAGAWPFEFGLQLTRGPRAIKTAAVLMRLGKQGVVQTISRHRSLAIWLAEQIEASDDLELTAPAALSIVCFRHKPRSEAMSPVETDTLNQRIAETVNSGGKAFLTPTVINGRISLRACIIHYGVKKQHLERLISEIRLAAAQLRCGDLAASSGLLIRHGRA